MFSLGVLVSKLLTSRGCLDARYWQEAVRNNVRDEGLTDWLGNACLVTLLFYPGSNSISTLWKGRKDILGFEGLCLGGLFSVSNKG